MERQFIVLLSETRNMHGTSTETFQRNLDKSLKTVPDEPRNEDYVMCVVAERNGIINKENVVSATCLLAKSYRRYPLSLILFFWMISWQI